jgi:septal ring factor EnvC (AmiA/AmiB activator)
MASGFSRRLSRWACLWWAALVAGLLLLASPPIAPAQTPSADKPKSTEEWLTDSLAASAQLRQALSEQRQTRADLSTAYESLKAQLQASEASATQRIAELQAQLQTSSESERTRLNELQTQLQSSTQQSRDLQAEIQTLTVSLTESKQESVALSGAFDQYQKEMKGQVATLERQRNIWRAAGISGWVLAVITTVWEATR